MREIVLSMLLFVSIYPYKAQAQGTFELAENGITITCNGAEAGDTGEVNGIMYTAVDRELLISKRDAGEDLTRVCTSLVTNMELMFVEFHQFNQDISSWDVSSVKDMGGMFFRASSFNKPIGSWDVSSVVEMQSMFYEALSFNQPINNWDVSSVEYIRGMFAGAKSFNQEIGSWDVGLTTNMYKMFKGASTFNQDISNWDVSSVTATGLMFEDATSFNQEIGNWDVSSVTEMVGMFSRASAFNGDISDWDVSSVSDMDGMFSNASAFNQDISNWDVSLVRGMAEMFHYASAFNQNLRGWCVKNILKEPIYFGVGSALPYDFFPSWGSCVATSTEQKEELPITFALNQNYPNPFNPSTSISFELPEAVNVKVSVYNMLGQEVEVLVDGFQNAGVHTLTFDARGLSSGVYIYRLTTPNLSFAKRMLLLK